jgi:hypothetical protein
LHTQLVARLLADGSLWTETAIDAAETESVEFEYGVPSRVSAS